MSCHNEACSPLIVVPAVPRTGRLQQSALIAAAFAFIDAFGEALQMREAAYRRYRFSE